MQFSTGSGLTKLLAIIFVTLLAWAVWQLKDRNGVDINSYKDCVTAGNAIQESFPEVCRTLDGRSFINPNQQAPTAP